NIEIIKLLLSYPNLHVNEINENGQTALHYGIIKFVNYPEDIDSSESDAHSESTEKEDTNRNNSVSTQIKDPDNIQPLNNPNNTDRSEDTNSSEDADNNYNYCLH